MRIVISRVCPEHVAGLIEVIKQYRYQVEGWLESEKPGWVEILPDENQESVVTEAPADNSRTPEDEAFRLHGYTPPSWCSCVFSENRELLPCIKCGAVSPFIYESVSGFAAKGPICPTCHDEIDDCGPEHGETDTRTPWPIEANLQAGGTVSKETLRALKWLPI